MLFARNRTALRGLRPDIHPGAFGMWPLGTRGVWRFSLLWFALHRTVERMSSRRPRWRTGLLEQLLRTNGIRVCIQGSYARVPLCTALLQKRQTQNSCLQSRPAASFSDTLVSLSTCEAWCVPMITNQEKNTVDVNPRMI